MSRPRRYSFYTLIGVFALLLGFLTPLPYAVVGWFVEESGGVSHLVHEISFGVLFGLSLAGWLAQFSAPERRLAQVYQGVVPIWLIMLSSVLLGGGLDPIVILFLVIPVVLIALHPARASVLRPPIAPDRLLLSLVIVATVPVAVFATDQLRLAAAASAAAADALAELPDDAGEEEFERAIARVTSGRERVAAQHFGHWSAMAAFALSILALAIVAALGLPGWRMPGWSAAIGAAYYAVGSLAFPTDASAYGGVWGIAVLAWSAAFVFAAERQARRTNAAPAAGAGPAGDAEPLRRS